MGRGKGVVVVAAGLVLAVAGCGGGGTDETAGEKSAAPTAVRSPSRELVKWTGEMCASASALKRLRASSAADLKEIRDTDDELFADSLALGYLSRTLTVVKTEESDLEDLGSSGIPAADRSLDALRKKVSGAAAGIRESFTGVGVEDAVGGAADVDKLVQSLAPPQPGLPALAKKDPRLAAAYQRAEQCAPGWRPPNADTPSPSAESTGPLPEATDGKNYRACSDGACEVLVTSTADITANGVNLHVTVGSSVTFQTPGTVMNLVGQGGVAQFGGDLKVTVVARNEDGAVLEFAIP